SNKVVVSATTFSSNLLLNVVPATFILHRDIAEVAFITTVKSRRKIGNMWTLDERVRELSKATWSGRNGSPFH
ncbi:hypothetical protein A2U01_0048154, partial [Trifolium medium]|nr:hypothetical protein [Trifolium medium]